MRPPTREANARAGGGKTVSSVRARALRSDLYTVLDSPLRMLDAVGARAWRLRRALIAPIRVESILITKRSGRIRDLSVEHLPAQRRLQRVPIGPWCEAATDLLQMRRRYVRPQHLLACRSAKSKGA